MEATAADDLAKTREQLGRLQMAERLQFWLTRNRANVPTWIVVELSALITEASQ